LNCLRLCSFANLHVFLLYLALCCRYSYTNHLLAIPWYVWMLSRVHVFFSTTIPPLIEELHMPNLHRIDKIAYSSASKSHLPSRHRANIGHATALPIPLSHTFVTLVRSSRLTHLSHLLSSHLHRWSQLCERASRDVIHPSHISTTSS
jgi:hypothetical protein